MVRQNNHPVEAKDYALAKRLRKQQTPMEKRPWELLSQTARAHGLKFRRQHPLHPYIVDFVCLKAGLVVEVDGVSHDACIAYDAKRTAYLESKGYKIIRFSNEDIMHDTQGVVLTILREAMISQQP